MAFTPLVGQTPTSASDKGSSKIRFPAQFIKLTSPISMEMRLADLKKKKRVS